MQVRHRSIYRAVGNVPSPVFREIARLAGVHIYSETTDPLYINSRLIGIHMQSDVPVVLNLKPGTSGKLVELFDGGEVNIAGTTAQLPHEKGATKLYLIPQR